MATELQKLNFHLRSTNLILRSLVRRRNEPFKLFMQNKPNLNISKCRTSSLLLTTNDQRLATREAQSKPNLTQFNPISNQTKPNQTQFRALPPSTNLQLTVTIHPIFPDPYYLKVAVGSDQFYPNMLIWVNLSRPEIRHHPHRNVDYKISPKPSFRRTLRQQGPLWFASYNLCATADNRIETCLFSQNLKPGRFSAEEIYVNANAWDREGVL